MQGTVEAPTLCGQRHRAQRGLHAPLRSAAAASSTSRAARPAGRSAAGVDPDDASAALRRAHLRTRERCAWTTTRSPGRATPICSCAAPSIGRCSSAAPRSIAASSPSKGKRYSITRGTIDFNNPTRIEPFFDIETETRVRVPGQTYRVTVRATGTLARFTPTFSADPPLPEVEVLSLLFSDVAPGRDVEFRQYSTHHAAAAAAARARHARADRRALLRGRPRRRADVRRRHVPADAVAGRSQRAVVAPRSRRAADDRQAPVRSDLPDLLAQPVVVDARSDHPARVRSDRPLLVDSVAQRGSHLRARRPRPARVLMRACRIHNAKFKMQNANRMWYDSGVKGAAPYAPFLRVALGLHFAFCILNCSGAALGAAQHPRQPSATVDVEQEGEPVTDPLILSLVETRSGSRCRWRTCARPITHLISLTRFEDVQVYEDPAAWRRPPPLRAVSRARRRSHRVPRHARRARKTCCAAP